MQPQQGLEFWARWLQETGTILDNGKAWFGAAAPNPPGAPSLVPGMQGEPLITLAWTPPPLRSEGHPAPVEGYILQMKDVGTTKELAVNVQPPAFEVGVWHDALGLLLGTENHRQGTSTCTWSSECEWQLGLCAEHGTKDCLLRAGRKYTFRVLAVNRMGASEPGAEMAEAIEPPARSTALPAKGYQKPKTTRPETRRKPPSTISLDYWHFSLLFLQANADATSDEDVIKRFGGICQEHGKLLAVPIICVSLIR